MKILAIDSNSILNRAFYGIKLLTTKNGEYTNAVFGFMNILFRLLDDISPDAVVFAFDVKAKTFRHKHYSDYKGTRKKASDEFISQLPLIKQLLSNLGYTIIEKEGFEADDILGTIAYRASLENHNCIIATGDKDSLQLVDKNVNVLLATTKMGKASYDIYTPETVFEKYQLYPDKLIDLKAIMGDSSDNIPGVFGIGEKGAISLIKTFDSLDGVYENLDSDQIKANMRKKLIDSKDNAYMSKFLATIVKDVPLDINFSSFVKKDTDQDETFKLLARLEMFQTIKKLNLSPPANYTEQTPNDNSTQEPSFNLKITPCDDFETFFKLANDKKLVYIDLDCQNLSLLCDSFSFSGCLDTLKPLLICQDIKKITFDAKSLFYLLSQNNIELVGVDFDVTLASYLLNSSSKDYSKDRLIAEYDIVLEENSSELVKLFCLYQKLFPLICEQDMLKLLQEIELPLAKVLSQMELVGFSVDKDGLLDFRATLDAELSDLTGAIYSCAGKEFNINSPKQLADILFVELSLPARKKTKTGYSTNAEVLESLVNEHPIISYILDYRKISKLLSTYVDGLLSKIADDGKLHTTFIQTETRTGRISSVEPNLQNIPIRTELGSTLRKFFVASPNHILIDADYSQIELRLLAHIADDKTMLEAFQNNIDIHTQTASQVFDMPINMVTKTMRSSAKAVNFGIIYGIGAFSLAKDIDVSVKEAKHYIEQYLSKYSGAADYMKNIVDFGTEHGYVKTLFNRRRIIPELRSTNKIIRASGQRIAMNTPIQGTAADIIKLAMVRVHTALSQSNLSARLILQVHDELIVEAPIEEQEAVSVIVKREMEQVFKLSVNLLCDLKAGFSWFDAH